jgi:hypothetical protein
MASFTPPWRTLNNGYQYLPRSKWRIWALKYTIVSSYLSIKQALCKWIYLPTQSFGSNSQSKTLIFTGNFLGFPEISEVLKNSPTIYVGFARFDRRCTEYRPANLLLVTSKYRALDLDPRTDLKSVRPRKYGGIYRPPNRTIEVPSVTYLGFHQICPLFTCGLWTLKARTTLTRRSFTTCLSGVTLCGGSHNCGPIVSRALIALSHKYPSLRISPHFDILLPFN